jgi:PIN domain nuclease of toxin-antitoxin system
MSLSRSSRTTASVRLLLDSHTLLWFLSADSRLSAGAEAAVSSPSNEVLVSSASLWEIAIKYSLGKISLPNVPAEFFPEQLTVNQLKLLPITAEHEYAAANLPRPPGHRDPFDRLLVCQCIVEGCSLVSGDSALDEYGITRLW